MRSADVYILDEPTRGIDVGAKEEIYKLIDDLARAGKAVIVISSELPELIGVSDRILVMYNGRIQGELQGAKATEKNIIEYATGVRGA
jgi:ABC-type sugar transport system ATPase subunit